MMMSSAIGFTTFNQIPFLANRSTQALESIVIQSHIQQSNKPLMKRAGILRFLVII